MLKKKKKIWFPLPTPSSGHISPVLYEGSRGVKAETQISPQLQLCSCLEFLMLQTNCAFSKGGQEWKVHLGYNMILAFKYLNIITKNYIKWLGWVNMYKTLYSYKTELVICRTSIVSSSGPWGHVLNSSILAIASTACHGSLWRGSISL